MLNSGGQPPPLPPSPYGWGFQPLPNPGHIPLRPLGVGEIIGTAFGIVKRHFALLGGLAVIISAVVVGWRWSALWYTGSASYYASGDWATEVLSGQSNTLPSGVILAISTSFGLLIVGALLLSGVAIACASADAMTTTTSRAEVTQRLRGRFGPMLVAAALIAVTTALGLAFLIVPGILVFVIWAVAVPASVMERGSLAESLHRAGRLTRGHRMRILGATVLIMLITIVIETAASLLLQNLAGTGRSAAQILLIGDAASIIVSSLTLSWVGAVIAVLYFDIRVRTERLGDALRAAADHRQQ